MKKDVIVVGGGVIGCSIAWRLAQAGLKVSIFERGRIGSEASRAAAGMLCPQSESQTRGPFFDLCLRSRSMYRSFAEELKDATGIDVEYKDEGTLFVVLETENHAEKTAWTKWQLEEGLSLAEISNDELRKIEPAVTESVTGAIFLPEEHQVENRRLMDALEVAIKRAGVELVEADVTAISINLGRVDGVVCRGELFEAGAVVVAAGAWSGSLLETAGLDVDVIPARGQIIAVKGDSCPITRVVHSSGVYVVPRRDGRILIGATVEYTGFVKGITAGSTRSLLNAAAELIPLLDQFEVVEAWSGLRPDTIDHLPIMGPAGPDNLTLATGHFRNGILLAPATAELIATAITEGRVSDELSSFRYDRFFSADRAKPSIANRE